MNFRSESELREMSLISCLRKLQEDILNDKKLYNKAFRLYEQRRFDDLTDREIIRFGIQEIPIETQHLILPQQPQIPIYARKYKLKERLKILFKGTLGK